MELPIDQEDFDSEIFETLTSPKSQDEKRYCPQCNNIVVGRSNKKFCTSNTQKEEPDICKKQLIPQPQGKKETLSKS